MGQPRKSEATDFAINSRRTSLEPNSAFFDHQHRGRSSLSIPETRRVSIAFDDPKSPGSTPGSSMPNNNSSVPTTPAEERAGFLAVATSKIGSRRGSRATTTTTTSSSKTSSAAIARSRPTSTGPDNSSHGNGASSSSSRFSLNMTKLTQRMSRGELSIVPPSSNNINNNHAAEITSPLEARERAQAVVSGVVSPSKESATTGARPLPKQRKDTKALKHEKRKSKGGGGHEDRDCVVM